MALFQNSVLNKHLKLQDAAVVEKAYKKYAKYFHNAARQQNIRDSKEEQFQEGFLTQLFVNVLGYTLNPEPNFNLTTELKNEKNAKKTDGAILKDGQALAVIELKSTKTKDLESIRQQAFDYKANQTGCVYVITSNFEKIRFYINNAVDFEEFNLFTLNLERFTLMYLCLHQSNLLNNIPLKIKTASVVEEEKITKTFYNDYSVFKRELFRDLVKQNMKNEVFRAEIQNEDSEQANKNIKLVLFKTSQKLIDRFLFIFFAEDRGLLPPNSTLQILKKWKADVDFGDVRPLYNLFKTYFHFLDTGRKGTDSRAEIFAYNGGLFKPDAILDSLLINDELLYKHTKQLSDYDFDSQVDVNILGHIFENSLNEIESVNAEIEGTDFDKQKTKRKKDGVFYTPKYITKYIVDNTIGKLCTEKKDELKILEEDFNPKRQKETKKKLLASLETYREWLLQLTICDPACGSGAFLNQALDFLIKEHQDIDELQTTLLGGGFVFPNIENTVLENNIFGVDLNEESVEIAKLSLWLRTAQPRRKLNTLNNNIKCGNSLIDSKTVAGDKAFNWEEEFVEIFAKGGFDVVIGNPPYVQLQKMKEISEQIKKLNYQTYESTGDLYCLFYEKGNEILRPNGVLGFITSNKWMRANYGKSMRKYFVENTNPYNFIDLGAGVFESAVVDSNVILFAKEKIKNLKIPSLSLLQEKEVFDFSQFHNRFVDISPKNDDIWVIEDQAVQKLLRKIELKGTALKDWGVKINYGIKTGYNDAFIINESKKNELIKNDVKSIELLKPILRGRDIKRYVPEYDNLWLVSTFPTLNLNIDEYVGIKSYLESFGQKLHQTGQPYVDEQGQKQKSRKKTANKWFETQDTIAYHESFVSPKILYPNMTKYLPFIYDDTNNYVINDKAFVVTGNHLKYLLAYLNSSLSKYQIRRECAELQGGTRELRKIYMENIRIPKVDIEIEEKFNVCSESMLSNYKLKRSLIANFCQHLKSKFELEKLSTKLQKWDKLEFGDFLKELKKAKVKLSLSEESEWMQYFNEQILKAQSLKTEIDKTDKEIDKMVYELYGLSEEEIKIVEGN
jgi:type I restriction-modification system DNA methylase subunit